MLILRVGAVLAARQDRGGTPVGSSSQSYVPISVKGAVLSILVVLLLLAGKDSLLALLAGLAPLAFAGGETTASTRDSTGAAEEDGLDPVLERLHEVQVRAWRPLGAMAHFIDLDRPDRGVWAGAEIPMPLVMDAAAPAGRPGAGVGLTGEDVEQLVEGLHTDHRRLAILGGEDTGKTSVLLALFMQAQHDRDAETDPDERRRFPLPLRISLSGWPADDDESAAMSLLGWMVSRLEQDYPGLLAHGASLEALMGRIWDSDELRGDRLMLFIDGIDTLPERQRIPLLERIFDETRGRSMAIACRTETWDGLTERERDSWSNVTLAVPSDADVERFLTAGGQKNGPEIYRRLIAAGARTAPLRRNSRLLHLLNEAYRDRLPNWLTPTASDPLAGMWNDLLAHVSWPNQVQPWDARGTLQWIAREGLFSNTRFAWWHVPQAARADPNLAEAYRWLQWRRARSALTWALVTFAVGVLTLTGLLGTGFVQGYDRASNGLQGAVGLSWTDVEQWNWRTSLWQSSWKPNLAGLLDTVVTNPVYLAVGIGLLVALVTLLLARFGGEFEHADGGQPQTIRIGLPRWQDLRSLPRGVHRRAVGIVLFVLLIALILQTAGVGLAGQLWAGSVFAAMFVLVLAWLHWCADATDDLTPAGTFASDRLSSRSVARTLGLVTALVAGALSWWFSAAGHVPTLGQCLWIVASTSMAVGLARGFYLGAGMGAPLLLQLRPGFGIGYAARLRLLERALRRRRVPFSPVAVIGILDLERTEPNKRPRTAGPSPDALDPGVLLRRVGPLIRLRESSLEQYLISGSGPSAVSSTAPDPRPAADAPSLSGTVALACAAAVALLICTGTAAVVLPRLPCTRLGGLGSPGLISDQPTTTVWLENGQCVGFAVLDSSGASSPGRDTFSPRGSARAGTDDAPERDRARILQQIAQANAAIPDPDRVVTLVFLAPLTRTSGSNSINALWQLDGARAAQAAVNADRKVYVRLIVANSGENFTSGTSVVQALDRTFPHEKSNSWSIKAVLGVAQSRTSAREALAQFDDVQIVGASLNGTDMRHGLVSGQQVDFGSRFVAMAPSDGQVAGAMLDPAVLERARSLLPNAAPSGSAQSARLRIIRDPDDTYFSNDLSNELLSRSTDTTPPYELREVASGRQLRTLADTLCSPDNADVVWLFAGRGNQLAVLDRKMTEAGRSDCSPVVIAGPGGISAAAGSDAAPLVHMRNLLFYSLAGNPAAAEGQRVGWANAVARASERATGYASVVEAVRRLLPTGSRACPFHPDPTIAAIGVHIPPGAAGDGHNTLQAGNECGAPPGSPIYFCGFRMAVEEPCVAVRPDSEPVDSEPVGSEPVK